MIHFPDASLADAGTDKKNTGQRLRGETRLDANAGSDRKSGRERKRLVTTPALNVSMWMPQPHVIKSAKGLN